MTEGSLVVLEYRSWQPPSPMPSHARVEVWSGQAWEFVSEEVPGVLGEWSQRAHDLTPFGHGSLRVRFCYSRPVPSPGTFAGWSVDDVFIGSPECQQP